MCVVVIYNASFSLSDLLHSVWHIQDHPHHHKWPNFVHFFGWVTLNFIQWNSTLFVVVVQLLSGVRLFTTPWTAAHQASLSFTISLSLLKFTSIESVMPSNYLILCCPLLLLPSIFPIIRVFSKESALHIRYVAENTDSISFWRWGNIQEKSHQLCSPKDTQFTSAKVGQKIWISFICVIHLFCSVFFFNIEEKSEVDMLLIELNLVLK